MIRRPHSSEFLAELEASHRAESRAARLANERRRAKAECAAVEAHDFAEALSSRWARWHARGPA